MSKLRRAIGWALLPFVVAFSLIVIAISTAIFIIGAICSKDC
jgi:hypothetical protein